MKDDLDLVAFLLELDDPADRQRIAAELDRNPAATRRLAATRQLLAPLEADRDPPVPPDDLVARTIGCVAAHIREHEAPEPQSETPNTIERLARMSPRQRRMLFASLDRPTAPPSRWRPADLVVTAAVVFIGLGIIFAVAPYLRHRYQVAACGNNLKQLALALDTYADTHHGRFPQVGERPGDSVWTTLREAGTMPITDLSECPGAGPGQLSGYAYSLGYRDEHGQLSGLRRDLELPVGSVLLPIAADRPALGRTSPSTLHRYGQNVLFVGGHVRFCTTGTVGVAGDDIYLNQAQQVRAGLKLWDSVLGVSGDLP